MKSLSFRILDMVTKKHKLCVLKVEEGNLMISVDDEQGGNFSRVERTCLNRVVRGEMVNLFRFTNKRKLKQVAKMLAVNAL